MWPQSNQGLSNLICNRVLVIKQIGYLLITCMFTGGIGRYSGLLAVVVVVVEVGVLVAVVAVVCSLSRNYIFHHR